MNATPCENARHCVIIVLLISAIFGYFDELHASHLVSANNSPPYTASAARFAPYGELLERHQRCDRQALRLREDAKRHRLWVLTLEDVCVYDTRKLALIRRIRLPNRSVAGYMCPPDIALDGHGTAFVSNNVQPRLLWIGTVNFETKERRLRLISKKKGWEVGFGALAFGPDGTLWALTALDGSLFKIDLASRAAKEIPLSEPMVEACELVNPNERRPRTPLGAVSLCAGVESRSRRIDISPGLTDGYVTNESCVE